VKREAKEGDEVLLRTGQDFNKGFENKVNKFFLSYFYF
jgi:hypothetical protein